MTALYNEIEPFAAAWMRELMANGHIAQGVVDERSITDLTPADVAGPGQRHFFAGIGGWSYALRLAGVPDDADIWTGSCPCQPFSSAGKRGGTSDARHLWPAWFALIEQCRPPVIFGEQVASDDGLGWLDAVFADLERCGYAVGAADLPAGSIAPHIRQRLFFVAYAEAGRSEFRVDRLRKDRNAQSGRDVDGCGADGGMVDAAGGAGVLGLRRGQDETDLQWEPGRTPRQRTFASSKRRRLGNADSESSGRHGRAVSRAQGEARRMRTGNHGSRTSGVDMDPWRDAVWIDCFDGKRRPIPAEPALFPLASGVPNRVGLLRGSGNAIVPQVAATFIRAALGATR